MNITVTATKDVAGKKIVLGSTTHRLKVKKPKDDKKDQTTDGKTDDKTGDKKETTVTAPTCSYEYTDWGECVRATKKQTRTVKATKPAGCVERQKPALEQGCNPPPSEEDKRNSYLNCLCRCSCGWAGHIGVWYDPEGKTVPECKSSGPCIGGIGAWGCSSRHFFVGPNDCGKGCWEGVYGKGTWDPDKADKVRKDENKKFKKPLTVKINASKNPADFGDIVTLTAETTEGSGGYKWTWGGCAQDPKDANAKVLNSRECKPCTATVTATDQDGDSASASLEVKCTALQVKLTKEKPKENTVPIGGQATFLAEVFADGKPAGGSFSYIWERNPDALFGDPKNPTYETKGGSQSRNTATFKKTGTTPVWVSVLKEVDGRKMTVGESAQIPIEVVNPKLKLSINKQDPLIGEKVVITVQDEPKMGDDIITFWWEIKGDATSPGPEPNIPNSRAYSFKPKNNKPVTVTVHGKAKEDGSDLGQADITITAKTYTVTIGDPRYLGPKPKIWKCDTQLGGQCPGLVDVGDQQFAVFNDIFMKSTVNPALSGARYRWAIDPAGCGMPGAGDEIKMNCSDTGTYTVSLKVSNSDDDQVGEASRSVTISVSQKDLDGSKKAKEAQDKLQKAKGLVAEGKLDEAIGLANEAAGLDPKNTEASGLVTKWKKDRDEIKLRITKMDQLLKDNKIADAEKEFQPAQGLHPKYQSVVEAGKRLQSKKQEVSQKQEQAQRLKAEGNALEAQGKLQEAINKYKESIRIIPDNTLEGRIKQLEVKLQQETQKKTADNLWQDGMNLFNQKRMNEAMAKFRESLKLTSNQQRADYVKKLEAEQATAQKLNDEAAALQKQGKTADASAKYKESLKHWPNPDVEKQIAALEGDAKKTADNLWQDGMNLFNQKRMNEAMAKFRESLKLTSNQQRADYVKKLEAEQATAQKLNDEAAALQKQGKTADASAKYKESLKHWPNPDVEKQIAALDNEATKKTADTQQKNTADRLWKEGTDVPERGASRLRH